mmetsp:Transcript_430/g.1464  ORF Transcript_430/g.1464 Transcript_430/m.1464 type:complete len:210 (+) Transcript_430:379-1008(+)
MRSTSSGARRQRRNHTLSRSSSESCPSGRSGSSTRTNGGGWLRCAATLTHKGRSVRASASASVLPTTNGLRLRKPRSRPWRRRAGSGRSERPPRRKSCGRHLPSRWSARQRRRVRNERRSWARRGAGWRRRWRRSRRAASRRSRRSATAQRLSTASGIGSSVSGKRRSRHRPSSAALPFRRGTWHWVALNHIPGRARRMWPREGPLSAE